MTYNERILAYCDAVINDTLPNRKTCKLEKQACQRHLDDLAKQDDPEFPFYFSEVAARRRCAFTERLPHTKGKWRGELIKLEDHQVMIQGVMFGWLKKEDNTRRFTRAYIQEPRKNGKALEIKTPIITTEGWKKHGDLIVGDFVFSPEGKPVRILAVTEHYNGECFEIGFSDGDSLIAHKHHEWDTERTWYTKRKKGERKKLPLVETCEIADTLKFDCKTRPDFVHRIKMNKALEFETKSLPIDPYVLGVWLGDGTSTSAHITSEDAELLQLIKLKWIKVEETKNKYNGKAKTYKLSSRMLLRYSQRFKKNVFANGVFVNLKKLNLIKNKHIPEMYLTASKEQRYELLRGILDTDGTISKAGQISLTLTNQLLIKDCKQLMRSLGLKTTLKEGRATLYGKDCGAKYLLHCFPSNNTPLFHLSRKLERQKQVPEGKNRRASKTIVKCNKLDNECIVNCITVEGGFYLAGKALTITHNSCESATTGLFMAFADGEKGAEVYAGATTENQAMKVFEPAWQMVKLTPEFAEHYNVELSGTQKNPTGIYNVEDTSRFQPIVGKPGDGASPNCAIVDEYHEHPTSVLYDAMDTGMGARDNPLLLVITTAGSDTASPCYEMYLEAKKILEGSLQKDNVFVMIFTIDDDDSFEDFEVWKKANPNYGVSINESYLKGKYNDAMTNLSQRNILLTKHLNMWMNSGHAWCDMIKFNANARPNVKLEDFAGKRCKVAIDLASKIDIVAVIITFELESAQYEICPRCGERVIYENEKYVCIKNKNDDGCSWERRTSKRTMTFGRFYLPEETVLKKENQHYQLWVAEGLLTATEGARTDFQKVEDDLEELSKFCIIEELTFDPKEASYLIQNIQKWANFECIEFTQGPALISEPMKETEAMIVDGCFLHDGNKVLTWMFSNVVKKSGKSGGNVKYAYPTKQTEALKIDGAVAAIMNVARVMLPSDDGDSYNSRAARGEESILRVL